MGDVEAEMSVASSGGGEAESIGGGQSSGGGAQLQTPAHEATPYLLPSRSHRTPRRHLQTVDYVLEGTRKTCIAWL